MGYFNQYSLGKRKRIALWCTFGFGVLLIAALVIVYSTQSVSGHQGLSTIIANGYTTFIESAQSYFTKK